MKIKFWGVRGSIPSPGGFTAKIGGNTSCVEVRAGGRLLIFDMGTGARALGGSLLASQPVKAHVFFSHLHHDHTQGIPFFAPCFIPSSELTFYSVDKGGDSPQSLLYRLFDHPYFPVPLKGMPSHKDFVVLTEGGFTDLGPDLKVFNRKLNHPDGVLGFRVEAVEDGVRKVFTFCTDTEHSTEADANVKALADQSDVFVFDAQYTDEEYPSKVGWGHSTVSEAAKLAIASDAKRLLLFHHDPTHNDEKVLAMEASAQALFKNAQAAAEGLEIEI